MPTRIFEQFPNFPFANPSFRRNIAFEDDDENEQDYDNRLAENDVDAWGVTSNIRRLRF